MSRLIEQIRRIPIRWRRLSSSEPAGDRCDCCTTIIVKII